MSLVTFKHLSALCNQLILAISYCYRVNECSNVDVRHTHEHMFVVSEIFLVLDQ